MIGMTADRIPGSSRPPAPHPDGQPSAAEDQAGAQSLPLDHLCGQVLEGKYRIEDVIGRGGMGTVFRATHVHLRKKVAIKVLAHGHRDGSEAERRFLREARITGGLGHPNIVEVFDLGSLGDGTPFLVMELLEGETLGDRLDLVGAISFEEVIHIAEQVLTGLEAAHKRGVIHRDLKPDNIFLGNNARGGPPVVKILDFGISKDLGDEGHQSLTMTGAIVGTPYYLSPEQARGGKDYDHRIDIWAVGVLMYEALTGALPFYAHKNYHALVHKILNERPKPVSAYRKLTPPALEAVVATALARERDERFADAGEMLEALQAAKAALQEGCHSIHLPILNEITAPDVDLPPHQDRDAEDPTEISDSPAFQTGGDHPSTKR